MTTILKEMIIVQLCSCWSSKCYGLLQQHRPLGSRLHRRNRCRRLLPIAKSKMEIWNWRSAWCLRGPWILWGLGRRSCWLLWPRWRILLHWQSHTTWRPAHRCHILHYLGRTTQFYVLLFAEEKWSTQSKSDIWSYRFGLYITLKWGLHADDVPARRTQKRFNQTV